MVVMIVPVSLVLLALALVGLWIALRRIVMVAPDGLQLAYVIIFGAAALFFLVFFAAALAVALVPATS